MDRISFIEARANLEAVVDKIVADRAPITIFYSNRQDGVVIIPAEEWLYIQKKINQLQPSRGATR